jgi:hypothetical protein
MDLGLMLRPIFPAPAPLFAPIFVARPVFLILVDVQILVRGELARAPAAGYVIFFKVLVSFSPRGEAFAILAEERVLR